MRNLYAKEIANVFGGATPKYSGTITLKQGSWGITAQVSSVIRALGGSVSFGKDSTVTIKCESETSQGVSQCIKQSVESLKNAGVIAEETANQPDTQTASIDDALADANESGYGEADFGDFSVGFEDSAPNRNLFFQDVD